MLDSCCVAMYCCCWVGILFGATDNNLENVLPERDRTWGERGANYKKRDTPLAAQRMNACHKQKVRTETVSMHGQRWGWTIIFNNFWHIFTVHLWCETDASSFGETDSLINLVDWPCSTQCLFLWQQNMCAVTDHDSTGDAVAVVCCCCCLNTPDERN